MGIDYISNEILSLESSFLYIKAMIEYYKNKEYNGLIMSINAPNLSPVKTKEFDSHNTFLYYTSLILGYQPDFVFLMIDEFTDTLSISNMIMNLNSYTSIKVVGIILLNFNNISNSDFYLSEFEKKKTFRKK